MQHYLDFEGYPLGDLTAQDWSAYQDSSSITATVVDSGGVEGQIMEVEVTVSPVRWLAWDGPGESTDVEIYIRQRLDVFRYSHGVFFRGQAGGDFLAAVMDLQADQFILSGSAVAAPETVVQGDIWHMVVRANAGDVMGKAWRDGSPEPSSWLINQSTTITSGGRLGVISDDAGVVPYYEFGVGTNGDPAPRTADTPATATTMQTSTVTPYQTTSTHRDQYQSELNDQNLYNVVTETEPIVE